jgi:hypothetical protein
MKSMDEGQGSTENKGYSAAGDAVMCSVEQVYPLVLFSGINIHHAIKNEGCFLPTIQCNVLDY